MNLYHGEHLYIVRQQLDSLTLRHLYVRIDMITRLRFLRHLEVSLSAAWFGRQELTRDERARLSFYRGANAG